MKNAIIISLLSITTLNAFAQSAPQPIRENSTTCMKDPDMPKNAVPAWPKSAYKPIEDPSCPPCYEYKTKHGTTVMECPFLSFFGDKDILPNATTVAMQTDANGTMDVQAQNTYTGNYPNCKRDADMPANAKPVWPKSAYTPTGNPNCAPCYEYTNKHGLTIMECPHLVFLPENKE